MTDLDLRTLYQQAQMALGQGDYVGATSIAEQMLRKQRNEVNALLILADVANRTWQPDEAARYMAKIVKAQPKHAPFRVDLANMYAGLRQYARAIDQYDKALKLEPGLTTALAGKAMVYVMQDRYDRARRVLKPMLEGGSLDVELAAPALRTLIRGGDLDAAIDLGRRVVATSPPPDMPLRELYFELARALERSGAYPEAFEAARAGNAILAPHFDPVAYGRRIDRFMTVFGGDAFKALPRATIDSELPIFIVGVPRCGSTLVERILHAHPQAHGAGELNTMYRITSELSGRIGASHRYPDCAHELTTEHVNAEAERYVAALKRHAPRATRIADKELTNFEHLGLLNLMFPKARVIDCRRDPVDNCLSCYMERLAPANAMYATDLEDLGQFYRQYERLMDHWHATLDMPLMRVDYEAITGDTEATTRRILEFCGLPWDEACLQSHRVKRVEQTLSSDQVRQPIYRSSVGRAERFGALLDPLREALGRP
jgi:tetratricopeptide (TPR) repeat protein